MEPWTAISAATWNLLKPWLTSLAEAQNPQAAVFFEKLEDALIQDALAQALEASMKSIAADKRRAKYMEKVRARLAELKGE